MEIKESKRALIENYVNLFEKDYLLEEKGQKHLLLYKKEEQEVKKYWKYIKDKKAKGEKYFDDVLEKMLPYLNTRHNRERGYRISVMPAIKKDLKSWFENANWQSSDNWENVGNAIFNLIFEVVEKGNYEALRKFEEKSEVSKGIKSGFISPTFFFLNNSLRIINNKTIITINYILDNSVINRDLSNYIRYVAIIDDVIKDLNIELLADPLKFDMFCHFMCDKRLGGYAKYQGENIDTDLDIDEEITETSIFEQDPKPSSHWEAIYYITLIGKKLGYKTYVADPNKKAFDKKLGELADLSEVPQILKSAPEIHRIDAIWYKPNPPFFLFEVEDGGTMREALHRLYNAMAFDARFMVVCPKENFSKFQRWVTTAPFKEFEQRYNFRTYEELYDFYAEVNQYIAMREKFLKV